MTLGYDLTDALDVIHMAYALYKKGELSASEECLCALESLDESTRFVLESRYPIGFLMEVEDLMRKRGIHKFKYLPMLNQEDI